MFGETGVLMAAPEPEPDEEKMGRGEGEGEETYGRREGEEVGDGR